MSEMTHCPLCAKPLAYMGDEPTCLPCVIEGRKDELVKALRKKAT